MKQETTFKALKSSGYAHKTIKEEIQSNLIARIRAKQPVFEGLLGYEDTVVPQLKRQFWLVTMSICWVCADRQRPASLAA